MKNLILWLKGLSNRSLILQNKSANLFNVFTKTVVKIDKVNQQIINEQVKLKEAIAKKQENFNNLDETLNKNQKIKAKIEEFLA